MPELPEVETGRKLIHDKCLGLKISKAKFYEDTIVFPGLSSSQLEKSLEGKTLKNTGRAGKYFYLVFDSGPCFVGHLGMTGNIKFSDGTDIFLVRHNGSLDLNVWPPRFTKFELFFKDEGCTMNKSFVLTDPRRLARFRLIENPLSSEPISKLGFDPLINPPTITDFIEMVKIRKTPIKALLLNQSFSSGVGNWIADEILYQSRVHPEQHANTLTDEKIADILTSMKHICQTAVFLQADYRKFPADWLFKYRWNKGKKEAENLIAGKRIIYLTVGGRTSAVVPDLQKIDGLNINSYSTSSTTKKSKKIVKKKVLIESKVPKTITKSKAAPKNKVSSLNPELSIRRSLRILARNLK